MLVDVVFGYLLSDTLLQHVDRGLRGLGMRKRIDRIEIAFYRLSEGSGERVVITQYHRNGSNEVVGAIELDATVDVKDLRHLLNVVLTSREFEERARDGSSQG